MKKSLLFSVIVVVGMVVSVSQAAIRTWDNDSTNGKWQTDANWSGDAKPVASDTVTVSNGDTVDVDVSGNFPGSLDITVSGNSTLAASAVLRLNNATMLVESGSGLASTAGAFWDLNNGDITFDAGATCTIEHWEQKGVNTFTFNLDASGFTTLAPNWFRLGGGATIANATYTVDMANYTGGAGTITLVDFGGDAASMNNATFQGAGGLNVINKGAFSRSSLTWNDTTEAIELNAAYVTWDGGAGDGLWTSAANWSQDTAPAAGETISISGGVTVTGPNGNLPSGCTVNLSGNSTLTSTIGATRLNGATINVASGSTLTSAVNKWFDLNAGTVTFEDGAVNTVHYWEHKGYNTFGFTLSATGFTTLTPAVLRSGSNGSFAATWEHATFNIDVSNYDIANGETITLMDFGSHAANFNGTFNPTVNITRGAARLDATLSFDTGTSKLILTLTDEPIWDGGGGDGLWKTAANWNIEALPIAGETVTISNGDTVSWDGSSGQTLPGGLTVNLSGNSTLTASSIIRLNNATINVASGSTLTSTGGAFWDLDDADLTFEDGAACTIDEWENKDVNTFTFTLGATGFAPLAPTSFLIGGGGTHNPGNIANATYTVDMAGYTGGSGTVTLVDYVNDWAAMDNTSFQTATLNVLNRGDFSGSNLSWDDATESIRLNVMYPTWDGEAGDGLWSTALNWSGDVLPVAGDTVYITNGDTVEWDTAGNLPAGLTVNIDGNSTLHSSWVLRLAGSTINVASGSALTSDVNDWFDIGGGSVSFEDGAVNTVHFWEHKGANTFDFTLSDTGFTALTPNTLRSGGGATWSDATYNIDISAYDRDNGRTIVLMDFNASFMGGTFDPSANSPTVNITGLEGGSLSWDSVNYDLVLTLNGLRGTVFRFK